jgi:hypothetical protein
MMKTSSTLDSFSVLDLIKFGYYMLSTTKEEDTNNKYFMIPACPVTGVLYVINSALLV